ncbi:MAG: hypothetical protein ABSB19_10905 [Methylomonas sp.]
MNAFSTASYKNKVNLSAAAITLTGSATATEANYVLTHNGLYIVSDSYANVSKANATLLAGANAINLTGAVTAANLNSLINASYANLINLSQASIGGGLSVAEADFVYANINKNHAYSITDTAANLLANPADPVFTAAALINISANDSGDLTGLTVSQAQTLFDTLHAQLNGNKYSITDTAANLLANSADPALTGAALISISTNDGGDLSSLTVSQAQTLFDTMHAKLNGNSYNISDTAANLLANAADPALLGAATLSLADSPNLTINQAQTLFDTLQVQPGGNSYSIIDTAANLLANAGNPVVTGAASISLSTNCAGLTVSQAQTLFDTLQAQVGSKTYGITDTAANLLANAADPAVTGAASVSISANDGADLTALNISQAQTLFDSLNAQLGGNSYSITDSAANLLANAGDPAVTGAASISISANDEGDLTGLTVSQAQTLFDTLHAQLNGNSYSISDTGANLLANAADPVVIGAAALSLADNPSLTVSQAQTLFDKLQVQLGGNSYNIIDTAANLLANAADAAVAGAVSISLSANDDSDLTHLTVDQAQTLFDKLQAQPGSNTYGITDTAANLLANAADPAVTGAATLSLADSPDLTVSQAQTLFDTLHAQSGGKSYGITDTAANLLANAADPAVTGAASITLAANDGGDLTGLTISQAQTLVDTLKTQLNGNSYGIVDTAANLLANAADPAVTGAASITLAANDGGDLTGLKLSQAQILFDTLKAHSGGNSYSISDTAANLLANVADPALIGAATLSLADSPNLTVSQAQTLFDTLQAQLGGYSYNITDTAANLLANAADPAVTGAAVIILTANDNNDLGQLTVSQAQTLFDTLQVQPGSNSYGISDTAANLLANAADPAVTGAATLILSANGLGLTVGQAQTLFDTMHVLLGGNNYAITDTAANLLANAADPAVTGAASVSISANDGADLTALSISQAQTLFDSLNAQLSGNSYGITDSAANLLANAADRAVTGAASISISANDGGDLAGLTIGQAQTLFDTLHAQLNGNSYNIGDTISAILNGDQTVIGHAATVSITGALDAADLESLINDAKTYSASTAIDLSNVTFSDILNVNDAAYAFEKGGQGYGISDSISAILNAADQTAIAAASTVSATGTLNSGELEHLASSGYASNVDLSGATFNGDLDMADASYAYAQNGEGYNIADTVGNILAGNQSALFVASNVIVNGSANFTDLDTLIDTLAGQGYTSTDMSHLSITGNLTATAAEASIISEYLSNFGAIPPTLGTAALIINDSIGDVLKNVNAGGDALASSIQINGLLTETQLDSLMNSSVYNKLQFGGATVINSLNANEAGFILADGYQSSGLSVKDLAANLLSLVPKFDSDIENGMAIATLTDAGVKGTLNSSGGANAEIVLTSLTANFTISSNANHLTDIDISKIDGSSSVYTDKISLINGVNNEIITVNNHAIDLVGVNNLQQVTIHA